VLCILLDTGVQDKSWTIWLCMHKHNIRTSESHLWGSSVYQCPSLSTPTDTGGTHTGTCCVSEKEVN